MKQDTQSQPNRSSTVYDKMQGSTDTAKRMADMGKSAASYSYSDLEHEMEEMWKDWPMLTTDAIAKVAPEQSLPDFMDPTKHFALEDSWKTLGEIQFQAWRKRCVDWLAVSGLMSQCSVKCDDERISLSGLAAAEDRLSVLLVPLLLRCPGVTEVCIRSSRLANAALVSLAQHLATRLVSLDLCETHGFDDQGVKALAAFCTSLSTLRLAGCAVTADGLLPIVKHCNALRHLEVTDSAAVQSSSLAGLSEACVVERTPPKPARAMDGNEHITRAPVEASTSRTPAPTEVEADKMVGGSTQTTDNMVEGRTQTTDNMVEGSTQTTKSRPASTLFGCCRPSARLAPTG